MLTSSTIIYLSAKLVRMRYRKYLLASILLSFVLLHSGIAQTLGPEKGSLVIVGGNAALGPEVFERFVELAGGPTANIVIIPTASGATNFGPAYQSRAFRSFQKYDAQHLTILHTYDRAEADTDEFVEAIHNATGVWFSGGRQWRLADAYLGTKTEEALQQLLERGGVVGGSSAGATILGSYLVRGDTKTNTIMMGDHEEGFGFLKNSAIDQHLLRRNRQFDLVEVMKVKSDLLGIGLDEGTGIVVRGNQFEVIGVSFVAIYDPKVMTDKAPFYLLAPGDRFDLKDRKASRRGNEWRAINLPNPK